MTSSIAGIAVSGSSLPYCVTKAAQLQLMRVFAASQGPKVRCNAVCPGLLLTEWVSYGCFPSLRGLDGEIGRAHV